MNNPVRVAALLWLVVHVVACAPSTNAVLQSLQTAVQREPAVDAGFKLNPEFRYLRATTKGKVSLLVLGYVDNHPHGPIEVWYSAQREVLRLQNGRVAGAVGLPIEWRNVSIPSMPPWATLASSKQKTHWTRLRDVMPGYRFGVTDNLALEMISPQHKTSLVGIDPNRLVWFEERVENSDFGTSTLPVTRYAVSAGSDSNVVYAEQCLAEDFCFAWQRWPVPVQRDK